MGLMATMGPVGNQMGDMDVSHLGEVGAGGSV